MKLNTGHNMPALGLGTWLAKAKGEGSQAVIDAIDAGYRHIDTALIYENEVEVGAGIKAKIDDGTVKREDLFVTTKLWDTAHRPDCVLPACKKSLSNLGLDYVDMYLIHWPIGLRPGDDLFPKDAEGTIIYDNETDLADTWKEMENLVKLGLVKAIGVSNFNHKQLEHIIQKGTIPPAHNQIEMHPYFPNNKLVDFCKKHNITVVAYSPFGSPSHPALRAGYPKLLEDPRLTEVGKKYGKGANHVILRWLLQKGVSTIPKSSNKGRIIDNFNVFDFTLTEEEMKVVESLDMGKDGRTNIEIFSEKVQSKDYPFFEEF